MMGGGEAEGGDTEPLGSPEDTHSLNSGGGGTPADQAQQWRRLRRILQWRTRTPRPLGAVQPLREQREPQDQPRLPNLLLRQINQMRRPLKKRLYPEPSFSLTSCCLLSQLKQIYIYI